MKKPQTLRRHLEDSIPHLKRHPDKLHVVIESGAIATKQGISLSFEWRYELTLLFTDFVDSPDTIVVPLLVWLATNQPDLVADAERRDKALSFEAEPVDHDAIDIAFTLELTERVIVTAVPGGFECEHADEPLLPDLGGDMGWQVYLKDELIIESNAPV